MSIFQNVFDAMAELLEHIVIFNELTEQSNLSNKWSFYKKWLQTLAKNNEIFQHCTTFEINGLETSLDDIETVITGNIFRVSKHRLVSTILFMIIICCVFRYFCRACWTQSDS